MEELLNQIKIALDNKLYFVALQSTLTLPDICSALASGNGIATKSGYIKWYDDNVVDKQNLSGSDCYFFRCGMLHQGRAEHDNISSSRVIFLEPTLGLTFKGNIFDVNGQKSLNIDLISFCNEIIDVVSKWWISKQNDDVVKINYEKMIKCYTNGIPPFIVGVPVIG